MKVSGVDLSLADTGVATVTADAASGQVRLFRFTSKPTDDSLDARSLRLRGICTRIWAEVGDSDLVLIEQPTYGSKSTGSAHDRSGLWWMLVGRLTGAGVPVVEVHNGYLKMYATGSGRGDKDVVLSAVVRRYGWTGVDNNNTADALVLAAMAARHLGFPIEDQDARPGLPAANLRAMDRVSWPDPIGALRG